MEKISIIVPVYNVEKYLEKCVNSIINQTYKNLEIILINDGSKDNSGKICDELLKKDNRIKVIHKENSGLSATRNLGIDISTGEYISFIDSDDYISEDYCETLINAITKYDCDIASIRLETVREDGYKIETSGDEKSINKNDSSVYVFNKDETLKELLLRKKINSIVCTKLYRKSIFKNCKFKEGISYEDNLFMYEASKTINKIVYINKACYFYLKRSGSITATSSEKNLNDFLDVITYRYEDIKKRKCTDELYNIFALLESIISVSVKYVIANQNYKSVIDKSEYVFNIIKEYIEDSSKEFELMKFLNQSQKICLYLMTYNKELFYNFLATRQEMRKNGTFNENQQRKPKICLLCDVKGWAFDMIAQIMKKELSSKYNIVIDYFDMYKEPDMFYECLERNKNFDLIHIFWRKSLLLFESDEFKQKIKDNNKVLKEYISDISKKISTCVYDYLYMDKDSIEVYKNIFNDYSNNYYVSTKKLFEEYTNITEYKSPQMLIHDICDWELFKPLNLERFDSKNIENRPLIIGWVGNSERKIDGIDLKGLHTIIKPAIQELKKEGYNIVEHYADRNEKWRTVDEMPSYYSEIDVCLCTSIHEGTPRPVLEAMSSGVPIISTNVGIIPEAFGNMQKDFIIGDRVSGKNDLEVKNNLKEKLIYLYNNRNLFKELSNENIKSIKEFDDGKIIRDFDKYFELCLVSKDN